MLVVDLIILFIKEEVQIKKGKRKIIINIHNDYCYGNIYPLNLRIYSGNFLEKVVQEGLCIDDIVNFL